MVACMAGVTAQAPKVYDEGIDAMEQIQKAVEGTELKTFSCNV